MFQGIKNIFLISMQNWSYFFSMGSSSSKSKKIKRQTDLLPLDHDSTTVHVTVGEDDEGEKTDEETPVIHGLSEEQLKVDESQT